MAMQSHVESRKGTSIWKKIEKNIVQPILESKMFDNFEMKVDSNLIQSLSGIFDVNSFELRGPNELQGMTATGPNLGAIYFHAAIPAHNCVSNAMITIDAQYNLKLFASNDIPKGSCIYINYASILLVYNILYTLYNQINLMY